MENRTFEQSTLHSPEADNSTPIAFLLDVDGVITNPVEKKVTEERLFEDIALALSKNLPVALNTGRSNEWMIERVILPLESRLEDKTLLKNFFAVGEKGLTWASFNAEGQLTQGVFDRNGMQVEGFDTSVFLDETTSGHFKTLEKKVKSLIDTQYSHSTFFDSTKKAMISTEMHDGYDQSRYAQEQVSFTQKLNDLLQKEGLEASFNVDPTTIATDIQVPFAGKHLGAKRILDWLSSKNINPQLFIAVGDSSSDLEMADELHSQGKNVEFKYVNPKKPLQVEKPYKITTSQAEFEKGTEEIFENLF
jgi:hypothetical protein